MFPFEKNALKLAVERALEEKAEYFAIRVRMGGFPTDEIIINDKENLEEKMKYWDKTYNETLFHNHSDTISIVSWASGNSYQEIQQKLA
mgnify:CR=1 FL=1|jgi:hypothetical protein